MFWLIRRVLKRKDDNFLNKLLMTMVSAQAFQINRHDLFS